MERVLLQFSLWKGKTYGQNQSTNSKYLSRSLSFARFLSQRRNFKLHPQLLSLHHPPPPASSSQSLKFLKQIHSSYLDLFLAQNINHLLSSSSLSLSLSLSLSFLLFSSFMVRVNPRFISFQFGQEGHCPQACPVDAFSWVDCTTIGSMHDRCTVTPPSDNMSFLRVVMSFEFLKLFLPKFPNSNEIYFHLNYILTSFSVLNIPKIKDLILMIWVFFIKIK